MSTRTGRSLSITFLLALFACALTTLGFAQDQDQPPAGGPPPHQMGRGHFDPQQRTDMLTKQLKLSSDQQAKVLDILKSEQSQMESLRSDSSMSQEDRRSKMMEIHKATNEQIRGLLDPGQQKKWDKMQAEHAQWQGRGGQNPPPPPDSAPPQQQ
jgi:periplasmic protein CpxP/Spy